MMRAVHKLLKKLREAKARKAKLEVTQAAKQLSDRAHLPAKLRRLATHRKLASELGRVWQ